MPPKVARTGGGSKTQPPKTMAKASSSSKSSGSSKTSNSSGVKKPAPPVTSKPKNVDKVDFGKPKPQVDVGIYKPPTIKLIDPKQELRQNMQELNQRIKTFEPVTAKETKTKPKPIAAATGRDPEPKPKLKEKKVDLDELDKRIERRTKYPTTGERTKDLFFDLLDEVPGVSNAKHAVEKASRAALEMQVGRSLDYETPQEAEETIKYATEVAGSRLGWSEEKTETINKFGPNAPISFGQLESEKAKVLKEIEDKKDERDENGDS